MKKLIFIVIATVGIATAIGIFVLTRNSCKAGSCDTQTKSETQAETTLPTLDQIEEDIAGGAIILDVRTPEEFAESHAVGSINIPYDRILGGTYPTDDKDTVIYLYCRTGRRAELAFNGLKKAGYTRVTDLVSLENWIRLGGKTTE